MDAAIWGTRAAVISGADGTSNGPCRKLFGITSIRDSYTCLGTGLSRTTMKPWKHAATHRDCPSSGCLDTLQSVRCIQWRVSSSESILKVFIDSGGMCLHFQEKVRQQLDEAGYRVKFA